MFFEIAKLILVLFLVVLGYIVSGITENILVKRECFDWHRLLNGILKALAACSCLLLVSYIFCVVDLSGLGFQPETAITAGILVYAGKLVNNAMGLLGLNKYGNEVGCDDENIEICCDDEDNDSHIAG